jgi:hypothetical protein
MHTIADIKHTQKNTCMGGSSFSKNRHEKDIADNNALATPKPMYRLGTSHKTKSPTEKNISTILVTICII